MYDKVYIEFKFLKRLYLEVKVYIEFKFLKRLYLEVKKWKTDMPSKPFSQVHKVMTAQVQLLLQST